jgi:tol-pal system protein YbgF
MGYLHTHCRWTAIFAALLITALPACASFKADEDPEMAALRRELQQIKMSQATVQETLQDVYGQLHNLDVKVGGMGGAVEALASRAEPQPAVTISGKSSPPPQGSHEPATKAVTVKPPPTKVAAASAPKKPRPAVAVKKAAAPDKNLPKRDYEKAYGVYLDRRYDEALALFKDFLEHYPQNDLADNAQYWMGEVYYDLEDYAKAILAFKEVVTRYPDGTKAPDALLKIGYAYVALDDPANARVFLKRVIKNYPFSEAESKARAKLKELENL